MISADKNAGVIPEIFDMENIRDLHNIASFG